VFSVALCEIRSVVDKGLANQSVIARRHSGTEKRLEHALKVEPDKALCSPWLCARHAFEYFLTGGDND
jgi:hypothetical protein